MTDRIADRLRVSFDGQGCEIVKEPEYWDEPVELTLHDVVKAASWSMDTTWPRSTWQGVLKAFGQELSSNPQTQPIAEAIHDGLGSSDNSTEINCALTIKDASLYLHMQPTPSPGEIEPWMTEGGPVADKTQAQCAREYISGRVGLLHAFTWINTTQGHTYWSNKEESPYSALCPDDQAYIRLIASADGQPLPEVE